MGTTFYSVKWNIKSPSTEYKGVLVRLLVKELEIFKYTIVSGKSVEMKSFAQMLTAVGKTTIEYTDASLIYSTR